MNNFIAVNTPLLNGNEKKYLLQCIESGWISSEGHFVKQFEEEFSKYCNQTYGAAVSNGSVALDIAVKSLKEEYRWKDNDEIIIPSFTIISCAQSIIYNKLKPVFVDADPITWNVDTNLIEQAITPKTRAIMVVHIYGLPTDMNPVLNLAKQYNLKIIEDAAQSHGQKYYDRVCGSFGDVATFSFYSNKHITTGEGGMIITSTKSIFDRCKYYRNLCFKEEERFVHNDLGWNGRMSNLQAAIGLAQLEQLEKFITIKKRMGQMYKKLLDGIPAFLPIGKTNYADNHYWVYGIVLNSEVNFNAKYAMNILKQKGIGTRPFFYPMNKQPILQKMKLINKCTYKVSENLYNRGFYIPSGLGLTDNQIVTVVKAVKELFYDYSI